MQAKPSDLMPELQGRFPIRVELSDLTKDDFVRILTEPENSLMKQTVALLSTENVSLSFTEDAVEAIAEFAYNVNRKTQNISGIAPTQFHRGKSLRRAVVHRHRTPRRKTHHHRPQRQRPY